MRCRDKFFDQRHSLEFRINYELRSAILGPEKLDVHCRVPSRHGRMGEMGVLLHTLWLRTGPRLTYLHERPACSNPSPNERTWYKYERRLGPPSNAPIRGVFVRCSAQYPRHEYSFTSVFCSSLTNYPEIISSTSRIRRMAPCNKLYFECHPSTYHGEEVNRGGDEMD